jgi:F-type H+-transporting ATPase subunit delta
MSDAQIDGYAAALFEIARAEGVLPRVHDELFRFSRSVDAAPDLRSALTDPGSTPEGKQAVLDQLLQARRTRSPSSCCSSSSAAGRRASSPGSSTRSVPAPLQRARRASPRSGSPRRSPRSSAAGSRPR